MPIDGPLMAIDGPHRTAMAIDELRWDLSTGTVQYIGDCLRKIIKKAGLWTMSRTFLAIRDWSLD